MEGDKGLWKICVRSPDDENARRKRPVISRALKNSHFLAGVFFLLDIDSFHTGSVKKFVSLVKNGSFLVRIKI